MVVLSVVASDSSAAVVVYTDLCQSVVRLGDAFKLRKKCSCSGIVSLMVLCADVL
jgi:hypothetical protein